LYKRKGFIAVLSSTIINTLIYPLERARVVMALDITHKKEKRVNRTVLTTLRSILKQDRFLGLYRGFWFANIGSFPYVVTTLLCYDLLRDGVILNGNVGESVQYRYMALG
jgi:hypothetical protein